MSSRRDDIARYRQVMRSAAGSHPPRREGSVYRVNLRARGTLVKSNCEDAKNLFTTVDKLRARKNPYCQLRVIVAGATRTRARVGDAPYIRSPLIISADPPARLEWPAWPRRTNARAPGRTDDMSGPPAQRRSSLSARAAGPRAGPARPSVAAALRIIVGLIIEFASPLRRSRVYWHECAAISCTGPPRATRDAWPRELPPVLTTTTRYTEGTAVSCVEVLRGRLVTAAIRRRSACNCNLPVPDLCAKSNCRRTKNVDICGGDAATLAPARRIVMCA
jgi:hypothetical protein